MIYLLDFREKDVGGAVVPGRLSWPQGGTTGSSPEASLALESRLTFLLHGFNVDRPSGRDRLLRLAGLLPAAQNGAVVAVLWPGDHWVGPLSYSFEGPDADDTGKELANFLLDLPRPIPVSLVSHSLGARVVMETLTHLLRTGYPVSQVCLMAAAIDSDSLAAPHVYVDAAVSGKRVTVLSSTRDKVLKLAYPAGDLLQSWVFFRRDEPGFALGYGGPCPHKPSGSAVPDNVRPHPIPEKRRAGHGDYLPDSPPNDEQKSAAQFADDVLAGRPDPRYPTPPP